MEDNILNRSATSNLWDPWGPKEHIATWVYPDRIEIDYKAQSCWTTGMFSSPPKVWREVYKAVDGEIKLVETKTGTYHSPQGEHYTFD